MLTVIIKRSEEPKVVQLTQENIMRELRSVIGAEMLLEDTWKDGLRKTRTPFAMLVEPECVLSANYVSSNLGLMRKNENVSGKGGGYTKLAMIASCLGIERFDNRIYSYRVGDVIMSKPSKDGISTGTRMVSPITKKPSQGLYHAQIGFVPGAVMRYASIKDCDVDWDMTDLVALSTKVSLHLWGTGRRIEVNPNTTYVSGAKFLNIDAPLAATVTNRAAAIFSREGIV